MDSITCSRFSFVDLITEYLHQKHGSLQLGGTIDGAVFGIRISAKLFRRRASIRPPVLTSSRLESTCELVQVTSDLGHYNLLT